MSNHICSEQCRHKCPEWMSKLGDMRALIGQKVQLVDFRGLVCEGYLENTADDTYFILNWVGFSPEDIKTIKPVVV